MTEYMPIRLLLTTLIALSILQGCGPQLAKPEAAMELEAEIEQLTATGNYLQAADRYQQLAKLYPKRSILYQLQAAAAYLDAGEIETATSIVAAAKPKPGQKSEVFLKKLMLAKLALEGGNPELALDALKSPPEEGLDTKFTISFYRVRSLAHGLLDNWPDAVQERLLLEHYISYEEDRLENLDHIWNTINRIELEDLKQLRTTSKGNMTSWIELALINKTMLLKPKLLEQALISWSEYYPDHPAIPAITQKILTISQNYFIQPKHIALCLPLTGQLQRVAEAIRDGFFSAWYTSKDAKPIVTVYDANSLNIIQSYNKALAAGADFVVGPLEKRAISTLLVADKLQVPTLALNRIENINSEFTNSNDSTTFPKLIQFGLAPEDEARQAAERAIFDGHNRALVIIPDDEWGMRLNKAFSEEWESLGGKVLERITYEPKTKDYSTPVQNLLNINSSYHRKQRLQQKLSKNLHHETRIRNDADMIFMAATPAVARQIVPQFRYYRAADIPIYSSSHVYTGSVNEELDADMNGVIFNDLPWILDPNRQTSSLQQSVNRNWQADKSGARRFYALGIDAFFLIQHLSHLALDRTASYAGETGELFMDELKQIQRKLLWAKFINGKPQLFDYDNMH